MNDHVFSVLTVNNALEKIAAIPSAANING